MGKGYTFRFFIEACHLRGFRFDGLEAQLVGHFSVQRLIKRFVTTERESGLYRFPSAYSLNVEGGITSCSSPPSYTWPPHTWTAIIQLSVVCSERVQLQALSLCCGESDLLSVLLASLLLLLMPSRPGLEGKEDAMC